MAYGRHCRHCGGRRFESGHGRVFLKKQGYVCPVTPPPTYMQNDYIYPKCDIQSHRSRTHGDDRQPGPKMISCKPPGA